MLDTASKFVRQLTIMTCSILISILLFSFFGAVIGLMLNIVIFIGIILYSRRNQLKAVRSLLFSARKAISRAYIKPFLPIVRESVRTYLNLISIGYDYALVRTQIYKQIIQASNNLLPGSYVSY